MPVRSNCKTPTSLLKRLVRARLVKTVVLSAAFISATINILYLTSSFYMLQVYDRVLPGRSVPSLVALSLLAGFLYISQWLMDWLRSRMFFRLARKLDSTISSDVLRELRLASLASFGTVSGEQALRDLDQIRNFVSGGALSALFDLPWIPIYLVVCYAFHPLIGYAATGGAIVLIAVTILTDVLTRSPVRSMTQQSVERSSLVEELQRNAESLRAMGMGNRYVDRLQQSHTEFLLSSQKAGDIGGLFSSLSKTFRISLQSAVLGVGAYLVIQNQATAGIIIASSILSSRALAPIEQVIAQWKTFVATRQSWRRTSLLLASGASPEPQLNLPAPRTSLIVQNLSISPPNSGRFAFPECLVRPESRQRSWRHRT